MLVQQRKDLLGGACNRAHRHYTQVHLHCCVAIALYSAFGNWHIANPNDGHLTTPTEKKRTIIHRWISVTQLKFTCLWELPPDVLCAEDASLSWMIRSREAHSVWRDLPLVFDETRVIEGGTEYYHEYCFFRWDKVRNVKRCLSRPVKRSLWRCCFGETRWTKMMSSIDGRFVWCAKYDEDEDDAYEDGADEDDENTGWLTRRHLANKQDQQRAGRFPRWMSEDALRLPIVRMIISVNPRRTSKNMLLTVRRIPRGEGRWDPLILWDKPQALHK